MSSPKAIFLTRLHGCMGNPWILFILSFDTFYNLGAMSGTREIPDKHLLIIIVIVLYTILLLLPSITLFIKCLRLNVQKTLWGALMISTLWMKAESRKHLIRPPLGQWQEQCSNLGSLAQNLPINQFSLLLTDKKILDFWLRWKSNEA